MKQLILQKEFMFDLFCLSGDGCKITDDLADFLIKDYSGYNLICNFLSSEEYELAALENPILEAMLDKFISIDYNVYLEQDIQEDKFYKNLMTDTNIFLTNFGEKKCNELSLTRGYVFISNTKIASTWDKISKFRYPTSYKVTKDLTIEPSQRFENWEKLRSLSHPFTSMIIFDKWLFKNTSPSGISLNLVPLIENFLTENDKSRELKITLISEIKHPYSLKEYSEKLKIMLINKGWKKIDINIVRHNKACYPAALKEGLHARLILTNYMHIVCDASFNFFKKNGVVENVANITASLNLYAFFEQSYRKDISDIKLYISKLKNEKSSDLNYSDKYFPDKQNPLLN